MANKISLPSKWVCDGTTLKPKYGATSSNTYDVADVQILVIAGKLVLRLW